MTDTITLPKSGKPRSDLALFLKFLRERIDPEVRNLGPHLRPPARVGKRVTQEEVAEAIGVSREWYGLLESAATARTSTGLLDRVADVLMVTPDERARLFALAVPELGRAHLHDESVGVLAGFARLRALSKQLWSATSVEEVLTTASGQIADWFESSVSVRASRRHEAGVWESYPVDEKHDSSNGSDVLREVEKVLSTSEEIDALNLYPQLANAGDVGTPELHPLPIRRERLEQYARRRLTPLPFLKARVRSRTDVIAGFCIAHESGHSYSESDRAVLGAFAELASLALS
jgi:hypothetical protein